LIAILTTGCGQLHERQARCFDSRDHHTRRADALSRKPAAVFPARLAIVRVQAPATSRIRIVVTAAANTAS
jgi:hypothetical protein